MPGTDDGYGMSRKQRKKNGKNIADARLPANQMNILKIKEWEKKSIKSKTMSHIRMNKWTFNQLRKHHFAQFERKVFWITIYHYNGSLLRCHNCSLFLSLLVLIYITPFGSFIAAGDETALINEREMKWNEFKTYKKIKNKSLQKIYAFFSIRTHTPPPLPFYTGLETAPITTMWI